MNKDIDRVMLVLLVIAWISAALLFLSAGDAHAGQPPDPVLTPGISRSLPLEQICDTKWGADKRLVSQAMKDSVYAAYHLANHEAECALSDQGCEVDHLISRELGGADDVRNLWPQPYGGKCNAHQKDHLENILHSRVCTGLMPLTQAQHEISTNWIEAYKTYVDTKGCE